MSQPKSRRWADAGSATVELAVALPVVVVALTLILCVMKVGTARVAAERAAATAVRMVASGDGGGDVADAVRRAGGDEATVTTTNVAGWVTVEVSIPVVGNWGTWSVIATQQMPTEEFLIGYSNDPNVGDTP